MKRTPQNAIAHPVPRTRAALRDPGGAVTDLYTFDAPARGTTGSTRPRIHIDGLEALDVLRYVGDRNFGRLHDIVIRDTSGDAIDLPAIILTARAQCPTQDCYEKWVRFIVRVMVRLLQESSPTCGTTTAATWYLERWIAGRRGLRPATLESYRCHVTKYLIPYLGAILLRDLEDHHISAMFTALEENTRRSAGRWKRRPAEGAEPT